MSYVVAALQDHAQTAADAFCSRYAQTPARKGGIVRHSKPGVLKQCPRPKPSAFYRLRDHEASPFFKIVTATGGR